MSKTQKRKAKRAATAAAGALAAGVQKPSAQSGALRAATERVTLLFKAGKAEEALAALTAMRAAHLTPSTTLVNKVLTACGRKGQWRTVLDLLTQMRPQSTASAGAAAGVRANAVSYSATLNFCGLAGEVNTALEVMQWMRDDGVAPDSVAFNAAISACRADAAARLGDAEALMTEAKAKGLADVTTHNALLGVYQAAGAWQQAQALLHEMLSVGSKHEANGVSFTAAIAACACAAQPDAALALLSLAPTRSVQACNAALTACERAGRWQAGLDLLESMEALGPPPDEVTVRSAVFACCAAQPGPARLEEALALFRRVEAGAFPGVRKGAVTTNLLVRACDMAGAAGDALQLLAGILGGGSTGKAQAVQAAASGGATVVRHADWACPKTTDGPAAAGEEEAQEALPDSSSLLPSSFRVVHHEPGWQRRPRNAHDLNIFAAEAGTVAFADDAQVAVHVARADVPGVPGAFVLSGVLTPRECAQMVACSEAMGYTKDEPTLRPTGATASAASDAGASAQVGIDNCCWLVDESILDRVWARAAAHLPPVCQGARLAGLNARWRLFRYAPGALYRPHVDGAWPGSGVGRDGRYVFDAFKDRWSKLTFLLYLSGDGGDGGAQGGHTVFYTPSGERPGALDARGVVPRRGCVLCFPHGNAPGSLVHEGAAVAHGRKYVARTEVLYHGAAADA